MSIHFISTQHAPKAIGPYSQGTVVGNLIFTAGQVGFDPATGQVVEGGIRAETARALENIRAILEAGGSNLSKVVKTTVFLVDMTEFGAMNDVYAQAFGDHRPARSTVAAAALPRGVRVEIDVIATREG